MLISGFEHCLHASLYLMLCSGVKQGSVIQRSTTGLVEVVGVKQDLVKTLDGMSESGFLGKFSVDP